MLLGRPNLRFVQLILRSCRPKVYTLPCHISVRLQKDHLIYLPSRHCVTNHEKHRFGTPARSEYLGIQIVSPKYMLYLMVDSSPPE